MALQPRPNQTTNDLEALNLLHALIVAPPPPATHLRPILLRSTVEQRRHALGGYLFRTWVDSLLPHIERFVMCATLAVFGGWFANGPIPDFIHEQQPSSISIPRVDHVGSHPTLATEQRRTVALPYTTPDMLRDAPEVDFMAPQQRGAPAFTLVAPQPTRLLIPSIGLDTDIKEVFVVDGTWQVADYAAGYLHATALPGQRGNTVLAGHAGLHGAVFRDLGALTPGVDLFVDAAGWRYHYRVRGSISVWPTQTEVLAQTETPVLTLMTCTNWDTQRLVVVADMVDSKPTPRT